MSFRRNAGGTATRTLHTACTPKRESRSLSRYIEIGAARIDKHGDIHYVYLDRLPLGGFTGSDFIHGCARRKAASPIANGTSASMAATVVSLPQSGIDRPTNRGGISHAR
jgi:hypothetical protein